MSFDGLDAYRVSIEYVRVTRPLVLRLRRSDVAMADQLQRAVLSVARNIAEGAGEFSPGDNARVYRYALRSAAETVAVVDAAGAFGATAGEEFAGLRETGTRLVAMLARLVVVSTERRTTQATRPAPAKQAPGAARTHARSTGPSPARSAGLAGPRSTPAPAPVNVYDPAPGEAP